MASSHARPVACALFRQERALYLSLKEREQQGLNKYPIEKDQAACFGKVGEIE